MKASGVDVLAHGGAIPIFCYLYDDGSLRAVLSQQAGGNLQASGSVVLWHYA